MLWQDHATAVSQELQAPGSMFTADTSGPQAGSHYTGIDVMGATWWGVLSVEVKKRDVRYARNFCGTWCIVWDRSVVIGQGKFTVANMWQSGPLWI